MSGLSGGCPVYTVYGQGNVVNLSSSSVAVPCGSLELSVGRKLPPANASTVYPSGNYVCNAYFMVQRIRTEVDKEYNRATFVSRASAGSLAETVFDLNLITQATTSLRKTFDATLGVNTLEFDKGRYRIDTDFYKFADVDALSLIHHIGKIQDYVGSTWVDRTVKSGATSFLPFVGEQEDCSTVTLNVDSPFSYLTRFIPALTVDGSGDFLVGLESYIARDDFSHLGEDSEDGNAVISAVSNVNIGASTATWITNEARVDYGSNTWLPLSFFFSSNGTNTLSFTAVGGSDVSVYLRKFVVSKIDYGS